MVILHFEEEGSSLKHLRFLSFLAVLVWTVGQSFADDLTQKLDSVQVYPLEAEAETGSEGLVSRFETEFAAKDSSPHLRMRVEQQLSGELLEHQIARKITHTTKGTDVLYLFVGENPTQAQQRAYQIARAQAVSLGKRVEEIVLPLTYAKEILKQRLGATWQHIAPAEDRTNSEVQASIRAAKIHSYFAVGKSVLVTSAAWFAAHNSIGTVARVVFTNTVLAYLISRYRLNFTRFYTMNNAKTVMGSVMQYAGKKIAMDLTWATLISLAAAKGIGPEALIHLATNRAVSLTLIPFERLQEEMAENGYLREKNVDYIRFSMGIMYTFLINLHFAGNSLPFGIDFEGFFGISPLTTLFVLIQGATWGLATWRLKQYLQKRKKLSIPKVPSFRKIMKMDPKEFEVSASEKDIKANHDGKYMRKSWSVLDMVTERCLIGLSKLRGV